MTRWEWKMENSRRANLNQTNPGGICAAIFHFQFEIIWVDQKGQRWIGLDVSEMIGVRPVITVRLDDAGAMSDGAE